MAMLGIRLVKQLAEVCAAYDPAYDPSYPCRGNLCVTLARTGQYLKHPRNMTFLCHKKSRSGNSSFKHKEQLILFPIRFQNDNYLKKTLRFMDEFIHG